MEPEPDAGDKTSSSSFSTNDIRAYTGNRGGPPNRKKSPFLQTRASIRSSRLQAYIASEHAVTTHQVQRFSIGSFAATKFPSISTFFNYNLSYFLSDLSAGVTIGVQLLPKGMAYAMMAGLNKSDGVIVAMMCSLLYPLCGSTPFLCTGPDPIICLLISNAIQSLQYSARDFQAVQHHCNVSHDCDNLLHEWQSERQTVMGLVTLFVALFQILGNLLNAGFISNFITKPIVESFVCSAAMVILVKQLHYCLNMPSIMAQSTLMWNIIQLFEDTPAFFDHFTDEHLVVVILSFFTLFILFGLHFWSHSRSAWGRKYAKQVPAVLLVVILGIAFT